MARNLGLLGPLCVVPDCQSRYLLTSENALEDWETFFLTDDHANACAKCEKLISGQFRSSRHLLRSFKAWLNVPMLGESYNHPMKVMLALYVEHKGAGR